MSLFQTLVLLLFNDSDTLSYLQIKEATCVGEFALGSAVRLKGGAQNLSSRSLIVTVTNYYLSLPSTGNLPPIITLLFLANFLSLFCSLIPSLRG